MGIIALAHYWCMIDVAYRGDDCLNVNAGIGNFYYSGESIGTFTLNIVKAWIANGRFYPLAFYCYFLFAVFGTLHSYRIFLFCITLVMILLSTLVIKKLTKNYLMTAAFVSLTPMMFYLSEYYGCNPLLCFHGLIQVTVIWFMCSVLCLLKWIDTNKRIFAILTAIFYSMSLYTYEVAYVFIVFITFVILYGETDIRKAIKKEAPILVAWGGGILVNVLVRIGTIGSGYAGVAISFSISKLVNTALCMMAAAFPVYNAFATGYTFEVNDISKSSVVVSIMSAFIFILAFYIFKDKKQSQREKIIIYCMGSSLWILPALLMGMSARYQNEIRWGTDWLPYFVEVIGISIILVQFCQSLYETISYSTCWKWMKHGLSLIIFCFLGFMTLWNRTAAEHSYSKLEMNSFYTIQNALELGILDHISDEDIIHVIPTVGSEGEPNIFFSRFAKKRCNADILGNEEEYRSIDYSIYKKEYISKKIDLGSDQHIFTIGLINKNDLSLISSPYVYIPDCKGDELVIFVTSENTEDFKEIVSSDILTILDEHGAIIQIPYQNVLLDSIRIKREGEN